MNIAIVAPSPVPLMIGGAENLWWGLLEHLNHHTPHHADLIKLPTPERNFWEIVDSYHDWAALDVTGYDLVISGSIRRGWWPTHGTSATSFTPFAAYMTPIRRIGPNAARQRIRRCERS